ncbi:NOG1 family protein [Stetteria hydrogenophila]
MKAAEETWDPASRAKRIHVPTYDEVLERIGSRYPKGRGKRPYEREVARLQTVYNIIISKTNFIRDLLSILDTLHPFFWRLIEIEFDRREIHRAIRCIAKARKLAGEFWEKYRFLLLAAEDRRELERLSAEARGRMLSQLKRCRRQLALLRSLVVFLSDLPAIDPSLPTVIVAGPPSSGKSTFVRSVSRARPRVAPYPFTTREIHIGHSTIDGVKVQVIDTPGILDRPVEEMNPVERRAAAALSELQGVMLFLLDPTVEAYMGLERQEALARNVKQLSGGKPLVAAVNKADAAPEERLLEAIRVCRRLEEEGVADRCHPRLSAIDPGSAVEALREAFKLLQRASG